MLPKLQLVKYLLLLDININLFLVNIYSETKHYTYVLLILLILVWLKLQRTDVVIIIRASFEKCSREKLNESTLLLKLFYQQVVTQVWFHSHTFIVN